MKKNIFIACNILFSYLTFGQIGIGTTTPHVSSILDVESVNKGFLPPRMTASERDAINSGNPAEGLMIYNTDDNCINVYQGSTWQNLCSGTTSSPSGNLNASLYDTWSTDLRFRDFGYSGVSKSYSGYGITNDNHLYMWGRNNNGYITTFNKVRASGNSLKSPYFIDFPSFNGQVKKFRAGDYIYALLTEDNKVWMWGNQASNIMGNNPSGAQNVTNGLTTPIELTLPAGETEVTDIELDHNRLHFLTTNGNVYYRGRGYTGSSGTATTFGEYAKPSGASASFKYTQILGVVADGTCLYLKGSDDKYYAIISVSANYLYFAGNTSAPAASSSTQYHDVRTSSSVYEVQFPVGHGNILKITSNDSRTVLALDDTGKAYGWGAQSVNSTFSYFETDETNFLTISQYNYLRTPALVNLPTGETSFKDVASTPSENVTYFVGNSGKVYVIGDPSSTNGIGITFNDYSNNYTEIVNIGGQVEQLYSYDLSLIFKDGAGELFGLGQNTYSILGGFPNEASFNDERRSPMPLTKGALDSNNDNVQPVN